MPTLCPTRFLTPAPNHHTSSPEALPPRTSPSPSGRSLLSPRAVIWVPITSPLNCSRGLPMVSLLLGHSLEVPSYFIPHPVPCLTQQEHPTTAFQSMKLFSKFPLVKAPSALLARPPLFSATCIPHLYPASSLSTASSSGCSSLHKLFRVLNTSHTTLHKVSILARREICALPGHIPFILQRFSKLPNVAKFSYCPVLPSTTVPTITSY